MRPHKYTLLFSKTQKKGFTPKHVAEIGVWHPHTSNIIDFINCGIKTTLIEPDPESIKLIKQELSMQNIKLYEVAICDFQGEVKLCKRASSTFVASLPNSPAIANDQCRIDETESFIAKAEKLNEIDDGTIDLISIDTEGSEWFAIKNMISRPIVISIETHYAFYINPYLSEIRTWLENNNYKLWYKDKSDSVFVKSGEIQIDAFDKLLLIYSTIKIKYKKFEKAFKRHLKSKNKN